MGEEKREGYRVSLRDRSRNGTIVDGVHLTQATTLLEHGSVIEILTGGTRRLAFIFHDHMLERRAVAAALADPGGPFEKYYERRVLGHGAFAYVVLGVEKTTGEQVAIKVIDKKKFAKATSSRQIMDEVNLMRQIDHPNCISIRDVFNTDKNLYIVLELMRGGDLCDHIIEQGKLSEERARPLFLQMCSAVAYLHENGIVHRDLKPENILLSNEKATQIKITDFGVSRCVEESSVMQTLCGTPQFLAPEVLSNHRKASGAGYGKEVDAWSLGAMLYVMLSARNVFDGDSPQAIMAKIRAGVLRYPDNLFGDKSAAVMDLLRRLLTVDPSKRITIQACINHPWITGEPFLPPPTDGTGDDAQPSATVVFDQASEPQSDDTVGDASDAEMEDATTKSVADKRGLVELLRDEPLPPPDSSAARPASPKRARVSPALSAADGTLPKTASLGQSAGPSASTASSLDVPVEADEKTRATTPRLKRKSAPSPGSLRERTDDFDERTRTEMRPTRGRRVAGGGSDSDDSSSERPTRVCKYGRGCYRKAAAHFKQFAHPWWDDKPGISVRKASTEYDVDDDKDGDYVE